MDLSNRRAGRVFLDVKLSSLKAAVGHYIEYITNCAHAPLVSVGVILRAKSIKMESENSDDFCKFVASCFVAFSNNGIER